MRGHKITTNNYFATVKQVGFENLPKALQESHEAISSKTDEGEDWTSYKSDANLKRMVSLAFVKLEEFMHSTNKELSGLSKINDSEKPKKKNPYGEISTEVIFINRFLDFNNKILYKKTFEIFIDELQKAIQEKKITKKSPVAKDIIAMQKAALHAFNTMKNAKHFVLKPTTIKHLKSIIEKYENAYDDIDENYIKVKKKELGLSGINTEQKINIMPSTDFTNLQFDSIGFKDKWLDFIGDPAPGFTAMVFGMPKMGKSYLCVDFAGYLARNHGKVLYVAKEEKLDATLQQKLKDKNVANENLFVADALPTDLSEFNFIFLDSVNKLGLTPKDLEKLKTDNKGKSFIYIFQATKGGKFKGNNEFQHDVDVVIEVPTQGKAIQFGRFNQGGELNIFEDAPEMPTDELNGIKSDKKNLDVSKKVSNVASMKKKQKEEQDWTEPDFLNRSDWSDLKAVKKYYEADDFKQALNYASRLETIVRDEIPPNIWQEIGGSLTKTGKERLIATGHESPPDDINQRLIFSLTATASLVEALRGDFNINELVRRELANRGLDIDGNWVGFDKAAKIHKIKE